MTSLMLRSLPLFFAIFCSITSYSQTTTRETLDSAESAFLNKNYENSILISKELLRSSSLDGNEALKIKSALLLARSYHALQKNFYAFEHYLLALYYTDFSPQTHRKNELLIEIAHFFNNWQVHPKAIYYYKLALEEKHPTHKHSLLQYDLATTYYKNHQLDSSAIYLEKILHNSALPKEFENNIKIKLTTIYITQNKSKKSLLNWILSFYNDITDIEQKVSLQNYLGHLYKLNNEYSKALLCFENAYSLAKNIDDHKEQALSLERIGVLWDHQEKYDQALDIFFSSLKIQKQHNLYKDIPNTYNYISKIYLSKGQLNKSIAYADSAQNTIYTPPNVLLNSCRLLSTIYELKGNNKKKQKYTSLSNDLNAKIKQAKEEKTANKNELYLKIEEFEEQYLNIIQIGHVQGLAYENLKLNSLAQKNQIDLITKDQAINKQNLLLAEEHLTLEQKAREIEHLQSESEIQSLLIEKQKLQELKKQQQITALEKEQYLNALDLEFKDQKIKNQKQTQQLTVLVFIVIIFFLIIIYFLIKQRQNKQKVLFEREKKKTESKLFRSQMNPHFLFNSLNSIKSFIITNEKKEASSYLSKFALLMRHILDNSDHAYIPLEKEIETLSLYMELEKLRFEDRFDYSFTIDEELEPENTYIPPMLLQPHIENAILHGFNKNKKDGQITIVIKEVNNMLLCSVEDNGIGRKQSLALKSSRSSHKSKALTLVKNHLSNINATQKIDISMKFIDLKNNEGIACGTRVEIVLPLKLENTPTVD